ncbi:MAG TPA: translation initiation factor IF-2 [Oligoflexia bacterium]|nr:translation initiation factor IF-2 [Oligoflexia bacterium]HMP27802.1 translation initiation factor IF-2 [Oligoflexia bacterium]
MAKLRVYELAKELGVDNAIVLSMASSLGFAKRSHSSSIDVEEAEKLRKEIIRQVMGGAAVGSAREQLTSRVDRETGETEKLVEKRVGNVIRRRKTATDETASADLLTAASDSLFVSNAPESENESKSTSENISYSTSGSERVAADEVNSDFAKEDVKNFAADDQSVVNHNQPTFEDSNLNDGGNLAVSRIGPKILGKIDLPSSKIEQRSTGSQVGVKVINRAAVVQEVLKEEDEEAKRVLKKSIRKREISGSDLVDYSGRAFKRPSGRSGLKSLAREDAAQSGRLDVAAERQKPVKRVVKVGESILVGDLAKQMSLKAAEVVAKLMEFGVMATVNQAVDYDTAEVVVESLGHEIQSTTFDESIAIQAEPESSSEDLVTRPPVVTVMGHVDHGKTSLLDYIRKSSVAAKEHGGITQHIGAYNVELGDKRSVTFIDTPGHAAFTAMRARGAKVTDVVVLVVAADDGVMPQTIEAINHAKAAGVTVIVAVNKIDKTGANPDKIKTQLAEHGLQPEEWGGDTLFFNVSALRGDGIDELLEGIALQADIKGLKANPNKRARGTVIESRPEKGLGNVATILVADGTLKIGDIFVAGVHSGRVRSMVDSQGRKLHTAGPSIPVEITGLSGILSAGDDFIVVESEAAAKEISFNRQQRKLTSERMLASGPISLEEFAKRATTEDSYELPIILKADVAGSAEAVRTSVEQLSTPKVKVRIVHSAVGAVSESDVQLAMASRSIILAFGVRADPKAQAMAEASGVEVRFYRIIYELLDDVKLAMAGLLPAIKSELAHGRIEVREIFKMSKVGTIAGCYVSSGFVKRQSLIRIIRDGVAILEGGKISSLRRFKDDAREVAAGFECGISLEGYNDIKVGDIFESYEIQETAATLD